MNGYVTIVILSMQLIMMIFMRVLVEVSNNISLLMFLECRKLNDIVREMVVMQKSSRYKD